MRIRFGLDLDGEHGTLRADELDAKITGPLGLLGILETQLGQPHRDVPAIERIMAYRECLKRCDHPDRFYHKTFAVDDLETARTLLDWRDQWHLHGWSGVFPTDAPARLADMQDVETEASGRVSLSEGQRLARVAARMRKRKPRISVLELCEPLEWHPWAWQEVLRHLPLSMQPPRPSASTDCLLGKLQAAFAAQAAGDLPPKLRWADDGSLAIVRGETPASAGYWLSMLLSRSPRETLLVAPQSDALADTLPMYGLPRPNFQELSAFRPALQFLPLVLSQLWTPVDIHGLIKFMVHPLCPVPREISAKLAETVAEYPGIGGEPWQETVSKLQSRWEEKDLEWERAAGKIRFWLEHERYPLGEAAPITYVAERVAAVADHFRVRLGDPDPVRRAVFQGGHAQAVACHTALLALIEQGETGIGISKLQVLVNQCTSRGAGNPFRFAEAGSCRKISSPGAAVDPAERVVWWQLQAPALPKPYPWSSAELASLFAAGVRMPGVTEELRKEALNWQKPILAAQGQVVLMLPPAGQEVHPLWLMIESLFEDDHKPQVVELETIFERPGPDCREIETKPLPAQKRWWRIPQDATLSPRNKESFSSLEAFLFNPYQWVLRYHAKLEPGRSIVAGDSFLLFGNLSHSLVERYFRRPEALGFDDEALRAWFAPAFDRLVETEGALLLMPGRKTELQNFRSELLRAMLALQTQLRAAGVVKVEPEVELAGVFVGGHLTGFADLLVTRADGRRAIIDMKWAGGKKYPDKLAKNRHLQLTLYGELVRQQYGAWPDLSYFIISQAKLIAPDQSFFPNAQRIMRDDDVKDEGAPELWNRFLVTWNWRRELLDQGLIEVAVDDTEVAVAPADGMSLEILNQNYNEYLALAGWEEDL
ncbi:MAG: PD-(D/E)XK nuclease family protein [Proteobacteria bacterium]|nr:PD-(D/E)XK nuclease family protein [Pseudomonadota bacterium]